MFGLLGEDVKSDGMQCVKCSEEVLVGGWWCDVGSL